MDTGDRLSEAENGEARTAYYRALGDGMPDPDPVIIWLDLTDSTARLMAEVLVGRAAVASKEAAGSSVVVHAVNALLALELMRKEGLDSEAVRQQLSQRSPFGTFRLIAPSGDRASVLRVNLGRTRDEEVGLGLVRTMYKPLEEEYLRALKSGLNDPVLWVLHGSSPDAVRLASTRYGPLEKDECQVSATTRDFAESIAHEPVVPVLGRISVIVLFHEHAFKTLLPLPRTVTDSG